MFIYPFDNKYYSISFLGILIPFVWFSIHWWLLQTFNNIMSWFVLLTLNALEQLKYLYFKKAWVFQSTSLRIREMIQNPQHFVHFCLDGTPPLICLWLNHIQYHKISKVPLLRWINPKRLRNSMTVYFILESTHLVVPRTCFSKYYF